jgi:hypothetical protein
MRLLMDRAGIAGVDTVVNSVGAPISIALLLENVLQFSG